MSDPVTTDQIIESVRNAGLQITSAQVNRWQRKGLLPSVQREFPGRGKGSASQYPRHACDYALQAAQLFEVRRNLKWVGWRMWLDEFEVGEQFWRTPLTERAATLDALVAKLPEQFDSDDYYTLLEGIISDPKATKPIKSLRRTVGVGKATELLDHLVAVLIGEFQHFGTDDERSAEPERIASVGFLGKQALAAKHQSEPVFSGTRASELSEISRALKHVRFGALASNSEATRFRSARLAAKDLSRVISAFKSSVGRRNDNTFSAFVRRLENATSNTSIEMGQYRFLLFAAWIENSDLRARLSEIAGKLYESD